MEYEELDIETKIAIEAFKEVLKAENKLKNAVKNLNKEIKYIKDEDMQDFIRITEELRKKNEEKDLE